MYYQIYDFPCAKGHKKPAHKEAKALPEESSDKHGENSQEKLDDSNQDKKEEHLLFSHYF
jgi:hypothetical protein